MMNDDKKAGWRTGEAPPDHLNGEVAWEPRDGEGLGVACVPVQARAVLGDALN